MATLIREYGHFKGERKDADLSKLFIRVNGKRISLKECFLLTNSNPRQYLELKSYSDFRTAFIQGGLYTSNNSVTATQIAEYNLADGSLIRSSEASEFPVDEKVLDYKDFKTYQSTEIQASKNIEDAEVLPGMDRTLTVKQCSLAQEKAYFMVSYAADKTKKDFVKLDDLYILNGTNKTSLSQVLADLIKDFKKSTTKTQRDNLIETMLDNLPNNFEKHIPNKSRKHLMECLILGQLTDEKIKTLWSKSELAKLPKDLIANLQAYANNSVRRYLIEEKLFEKIGSNPIVDKNDKTISAICLETGFEFPQYQKADVLKDGQIQELTVDENGKQVLKPKEMAKGFSIYSSETVKEPNESGKEDEVKKVAISSYKATADGAYLKVTLKGETQPTMVLIANCYYETTEEGKTVTKKLSDCKNLIKEIAGKSLTVYIDNKAYTTELLSVYDLAVRYNPNNTYVKTKDDGNKLADNAYLKLQSGEYVSETSAVQPIAYKFTDKEENATAYLIEKEGTQLIIAKDRIKWLPEGKCEIEGKLYSNITKLQNLSRAPYNAECDVAQITSKKGNTFENCVNFAEMVDKKEKAQALKTTQESVHSSYKSGNYDLTNVYVNGELKGLTDERYLLSNKRLYEDYAENSSELACVDGKLQYKDGKLVGGPHYDAGKAMGKAFKTIVKGMGSLMGKCLNGNMVSLLALAFVIPFSLAVGAVSLVVVPAVNLSAAKKINNPKYNFTDKVQENQNKWKADVETLMEKALSQAKEEQLSAEQILAGCSKIDTMFQDTMYAALANNGFTLENGECKVTSDNAHAIQQVMNGNKQLNGNECAPTTYDENKDYAQTANKVQMLKAYMLLKHAKIPQNEAERTEIEKAIVESKNEINVANVDFDLTTGKIKVDGAEYSLDELSRWNDFPDDKKQNVKKIYDALSRVNSAVKLSSEVEKTVTVDVMSADEIEKLQQEAEQEEKLKTDLKTLIEERTKKLEDFRNKIDKVKAKKDKEKLESIIGGFEDLSDVNLDDMSIEQLEEFKTKIENDNVELENLLGKFTKVTKDKDLKQEQTTTVRLSEDNLKQLLEDIKKLKNLDSLYYGPDEDIPNDIYLQISKLEDDIKPRINLLKKAKSNDKYYSYNDQIEDAANFIRKLKPLQNRKLGSINL